jgi:hypothetical protein
MLVFQFKGDYMTLQEFFKPILEKVRERAKTKIRSDDWQGHCYYRHPETGLPCFIGAIIPDEEYNEEFETINAKNLILNYNFKPEDFDFLSVEDATKAMDLLWELQGIHDDISPNDWDVNLTVFEKRYSLS